jgi:hypothetical protein
MGRCPDGRNVSFGNQFFFRIGRLAANVNICDRAGIWNYVLSPTPNGIKITKL